MDRIVTITHTFEGIDVHLGNGVSYPFANQTKLAEAFARRLLACEDAENRVGDLMGLMRTIGRNVDDALVSQSPQIMVESLVSIRKIVSGEKEERP